MRLFKWFCRLATPLRSPCRRRTTSSLAVVLNWSNLCDPLGGPGIIDLSQIRAHGQGVFGVHGLLLALFRSLDHPDRLGVHEHTMAPVLLRVAIHLHCVALRWLDDGEYDRRGHLHGHFPDPVRPRIEYLPRPGSVA